MKNVRQLLLLAALATFAACASKATAPAAAPGESRYPDFVFPRSVTGMPVDLQTQHEFAWRLLQAGDVKGAERSFSQLARRAPDLYPAEAGLGYAALARKDHKQALMHFDRALSANSTYAPALAGRGQTYLAMNDAARALESFDAAYAADPNLHAVRNSADVLRLQVMQGSVGAARKSAQEGRLADARAGYEQAILTSPQSPFLFRELALVELKDGRLPAALTHARKAVELDPADARNHVALGDVHEALAEFPQALEALRAAATLEPGEALDRRIESLRDKSARAAMPEAFRAIEAAAEITRAQLAALIGVHLADIVKRAPPRGVLVTDVRSNWASEWILPVTRAGFMEVFPNHTFQPETIVRRGDLARTASQILNVVAAGDPGLAARLRGARRKFSDVPPGHLRHAAASIAVEAGVLMPLEDGSFQLTRPVTGAEAVAAVARIRELGGT